MGRGLERTTPGIPSAGQKRYRACVVSGTDRPDAALCQADAGIESGVFEIGDDYATDTYRAVYIVKVGRSLYILHAFMKKSKRGIRTPKREIDLIRRRLRRAREMESEEEVRDE